MTLLLYKVIGLSRWQSGEESACQEEDMGLIPGLGRSPEGGNGNPLQYSCLRNAWTEKPGGLQSMGTQRVRHNLAIKKQLNIAGPQNRRISDPCTNTLVVWGRLPDAQELLFSTLDE